MRILVVGSGAREHALVWKLAGERHASDLICAPGNPGIAQVARCAPVELSDPAAILALARQNAVDFTIVGPEVPLERGVADEFEAAHMLLFGPRRGAARLESSKAFAKSFMNRHGVPTAAHRTCETAAEALACLHDGTFGFPVVLKADGLAAGKGVTIAEDIRAAHQAVHTTMIDRQFGAAGARIVVEEHLTGPEVSIFVVCDGRHGAWLGSAQDHKRIFDDDQGPNTGGMGAFAPSPLVSSGLADRIMGEIVQPVLDGMRAEGDPFRGFLYVGLMLTDRGPMVIEFNVRLGDPEAQVVLPALDGDLLPVLVSAASGEGAASIPVGPTRHVGVVLASAGYPGPVETGKEITGIDRAQSLPGVLVFHAGTAWRNGRLVTDGGRVLTVVGEGTDYAEAIDRAYAGAAAIRFDGMQSRSDIGRKALQHGVRN
jgi:phosphoribosylamine--glycine ligase